jgi:Ca2+/Na+ antiporter
VLFENVDQFYSHLHSASITCKRKKNQYISYKYLLSIYCLSMFIPTLRAWNWKYIFWKWKLDIWSCISQRLFVVFLAHDKRSMWTEGKASSSKISTTVSLIFKVYKWLLIMIIAIIKGWRLLLYQLIAIQSLCFHFDALV